MKRLLAGLVLLAASVGAQDHPSLFVTSGRTAAFAQMKADYEANPSAPATAGGQMYKLIKSNADSGARYSDFGQWAAWMYHVTGSASYITLSMAKIQPALDAEPGTTCTGLWGSDNTREYFWQFVWIYDWLYPGLSAGQRADFLSMLNFWAGCASSLNSGAYSDSDWIVGSYMGVAMLHAITTSYNAPINTIWAESKWGGYTATSSDMSTYRNAISYYVTARGAGGIWLEGSEYNIGTPKILLLGVDGLRTATGQDLFPDVVSWANETALAFMHNLSPGINNASSPYDWGDVASPRSLRPYYRYETALVLAGAAKGQSNGPLIQDFALDWLESSSITTIDPYPRGFIIFDPYATRGNHTTASTSLFASGMQQVLVRSGWTEAASWFMAMFSPAYFVDHSTRMWGEFQLWKDGAWAITHPISYDGGGSSSRASNGLALKGMPFSYFGPNELNAVRATRIDEANGFVYAAGTMGGNIQTSTLWYYIDNYIMEHTRSFVYLTGMDILVVHDRANTKTPPASGYVWSGIQAWMDSRPLKELYIHSPVSPTQTATYLDWQYATGKHTRVNTLLPTDATQYVEDETTIAGYPGGYGDMNERKWHTRIVPPTRQWDTFLNVWDVYAAGTPATVTTVRDTSAKVDAALISRSGVGYLVAFNAAQGPDLVEGNCCPVSNGVGNSTTLESVHLRQAPYSLTLTPSTSTTKALLFDLDPSVVWEYQINGAAGQSLTVDSGGVAVVPLTGTSEIVLAVNAIGFVPPVVISTTSLPNARIGAAYSQALTASGGDDGPYTWSVDSGSLPSGLSLSGGGTISGTPDALPLNNTITKTAATGYSDPGGCYSTNSLAAGNGYVEFVASETNLFRMVGLSNGNVDSGPDDIDFGLDLWPETKLTVWENGAQKDIGDVSYATGDVLRIAVVGGSVKYSKNGTVFYTSLTAPTYPLLADVTMYSQGSTISNAVFDDGGGADPVVWTGVIGVNAGGETNGFVVEACDSTPDCDTQSLSIVVKDVPTITSTSLDSGIVGTAYSDTVAGTGGSLPYAWAITSGTCGGLSLAASTGVLSGTPTTVGDCNLTIRLTDDTAETDSAVFIISIAPATGFETMTVSSSPTSHAVTITYGATGLDSGDECVLNIMDGATISQTQTTTSGSAVRTASFTGLVADKVYGIDITCTAAQAQRTYFRTLPAEASPGGTVNWTYTVKPHARLVARSVAKVSVGYQLMNQSPPQTPDYIDASCATGCTVTLPLISGQVYGIHHVWKTAADATVATSRAGLVSVP